MPTDPTGATGPLAPPAGLPPRRKLYTLVSTAALAAALVGAGIAALLVNISDRRAEALNPFYRVVELTDETEDPVVWGKNFPLQFDGYKRTVDQIRTRFGGSEAIPRPPTEADPRATVSQEKLDEDTRLRTMWAGYAFAIDFREERGHAYMLDDQSFTERVLKKQQPGACLNCHASMYVAYKKLGEGDIFKGFDFINKLSYAEARQYAKHPVACIDCHDPATMALRVTRPAFIEGIRSYKASQGVANYDLNQDATRQEMRAFVCGQCHVEYYFKGDGKRLTYPWQLGLNVDNIVAYYDQIGFSDWVHADSGAPVLKAQHPEFEMWNQGIHARSGVACADCHMPYMRVGALKISDHHVRSPMLNVGRACLTCHHFSEDEMKARVEAIQIRTSRLRNQAFDALVALIGELKAARAADRPGSELATAMALQRRAQFMFDFVEAENSSGFHAPQESARILGEVMNLARQGQLAVRDPTYVVQLPKEQAPLPDVAALLAPTPAPTATP